MTLDFPYVGTFATHTARHGSVPAKATWSIPAETARGDDLAHFCSQDWGFILIAASDGDGRAKRYAHNSGTPVETA